MLSLDDSSLCKRTADHVTGRWSREQTVFLCPAVVKSGERRMDLGGDV